MKCNENAWWRKNAVSLTPCLPWSEMQWKCMVKQKMQCHSQSVGHGMKCNETAWWRKKSSVLTPCWHGMKYNETASLREKCSVTYFLLVMGWNATWDRENNALSLTFCWSLEMQWDCIAKKEIAVCSLPVGHGVKCNETTWLRKKRQFHSLAIGHGIKCNEIKEIMQHHSPSVGHRKCNETAWQKKTCSVLTPCLPWDDMQWGCMVKKEIQCHSLPVIGHGIRCDEHGAASLTS